MINMINASPIKILDEVRMSSFSGVRPESPFSIKFWRSICSLRSGEGRSFTGGFDSCISGKKFRSFAVFMIIIFLSTYCCCTAPAYSPCWH